MKNLLLAYFIILAFTAHGQNYRCLQPAVKNFFVNSDGYLRGIRIDSVKTYTDSTVFYPYRTTRGPYGPPIAPTGMHIIDTNGGSWLGKKVIELSDGTTIFDGLWGDSVIIKTQANIGDSWTLYNDSGSIYYTATVTNRDTLTILSALDSVKYIRINAFNVAGPLTSDLRDNFVISLSKNHGFAQVVDLYTFPYHKPDSAYQPQLDYFMDLPFDADTSNISKMLFKIVDFINPNDVQMHNWNIGDTIESRQSCGTFPYPWGTEASQYVLNTISAKTVLPHSTTYTLDGTYASTSCAIGWASGPLITTAGSHTFYDTIYPILNSTQMPEDRYNNGIYSIFYFPDTNTNCITGPLYIKRPARYMPGLGGYNKIYAYKLGIGLTSYHYADGEPSFWTSGIIYYHINGTRCGTFVNVGVPQISNNAFAVKLSPNPATEELTIQTDYQGAQYTITLQDLLGQTVRTVQTARSEETIKVADLATGMYIVNITDEQGARSSHKVVIQH